jgi:hypothetical protein
MTCLIVGHGWSLCSTYTNDDFLDSYLTLSKVENHGYIYHNWIFDYLIKKLDIIIRAFYFLRIACINLKTTLNHVQRGLVHFIIIASHLCRPIL